MKSPKDMRIIQIDITNACVYQCSNCTRFCGHHKKNFFMDFDTFKRAVDSLDGYYGTIGIMGGEPTLHPEFERFVKYLDGHLKEDFRKKRNRLIAPQKDFIQSVLLENEDNSIPYEYETGLRETVPGAGLWSAMVPTYKKHYEVIQDVFKMQAVNDHGNIMYHSPILINRKDLGIPDKEWINIRDNCWAQDVWSATITPKGAFFCEIAGALDMLFDGPGGWPIEPGWWKRKPEDFGDQLKWCELCGIAIETFTRDANEQIDDVSESMYKMLEAIGSPKLKKGLVNRVKIQDGVIAEESKVGVKEIRKFKFYDNFTSRFNQEKSVLYPDGFVAIVDYTGKLEIDKFINNVASNRKLFERLGIIVYSEKDLCVLQEVFDSKSNVVIVKNSYSKWGQGYKQAEKMLDSRKFVVAMSESVVLEKNFIKEMSNVIINPGTLHYTNLLQNSSDYVEKYDNESENEYVALYHQNAISLREMGYDYVSNADNFKNIVDKWNKSKVIELTSDMIQDTSAARIYSGMRYVIYGTGSKAQRITCEIEELESEIIYYSDSNCEKWDKEFCGKQIVSPEQLYLMKNKFDKIVVGSIYWKEIKNKLLDLGFEDNDIIYIE